MNTLVFDNDNDEGIIEESILQHNNEKTGALYEKLALNHLVLQLARMETNIRLYDSTSFLDKDDFNIALPSSDKHVKVQIKSVTYYSGDGVNTKGNPAKKKRNCWTVRINKPSTLEYKLNKVKFIIFVTCIDETYSYSGIETDKSTSKFLTWIVPIDDVLSYWNGKPDKSDYTIDKHDTLFQAKYYQNVQLLVDALNKLDEQDG